MRRAFILLACLVLVVWAPAPLRALGSDVIDGSRMLDYGRQPNFGPGSWVSYRLASNSALGYHSDYGVTLLVVGDEIFWGERCFWLETWTMDPGGDTLATASLISYAAFGDTAAASHMMWFMRKTVQHETAQGVPEEMLYKRDEGEYHVRAADRHKRVEEGKTTDHQLDTLAVDTVAVPRGKYHGHVVREVNTYTENAFRGDSTVFYTREQTLIRKLSDEIPITRLVREDQRDVQRSSNWLTGRSNEVLERVLEDAVGSTVLTGYGKGGLKPRLVPQLPHAKLVGQSAAPKPAAGSGTTPKRKGG